MYVRFACPYCGKAIKVGAHFVGQQGRCAACGTTLVVPAPVDDAAHAPPPALPAGDPGAEAGDLAALAAAVSARPVGTLAPQPFDHAPQPWHATPAPPTGGSVPPAWQPRQPEPPLPANPGEMGSPSYSRTDIAAAGAGPPATGTVGRRRRRLRTIAIATGAVAGALVSAAVTLRLAGVGLPLPYLRVAPYADIERVTLQYDADHKAALLRKYGVDDWSKVPVDARMQYVREGVQALSDKLRSRTPPPVTVDAGARDLVTDVEIGPPTVRLGLLGGGLTFPVRLTAIAPIGRYESPLSAKAYDVAGAALSDCTVTVNIGLASGERGTAELYLDGSAAPTVASFKLFRKAK